MTSPDYRVMLTFVLLVMCRSQLGSVVAFQPTEPPTSTTTAPNIGHQFQSDNQVAVDGPSVSSAGQGCSDGLGLGTSSHRAMVFYLLRFLQHCQPSGLQKENSSALPPITPELVLKRAVDYLLPKVHPCLFDRGPQNNRGSSSGNEGTLSRLRPITRT